MSGVLINLLGSVVSEGSIASIALAERFAQICYTPEDFLAKGDLLCFDNGATMLDGSALLNVPSASFTNDQVGKIAWVQYGAGGGAPLRTEVLEVVNETTLLLADANAAGEDIIDRDCCVGSDDTDAIKQAIAALPPSGGIVYFPAPAYGWSDPLGTILGDGSAAAPSTTQNIFLIGRSGGMGQALLNNVQGTLIRYIGADVGTYLLDVRGPIRFGMRNIIFDSGYWVDQTWNLTHNFRSDIINCSPIRGRQRNVWEKAHPTAAETFLGASGNYYRGVKASSPGVFGCIGWQFGNDDFVSGFDVSLNSYEDCDSTVGDDTTADEWPTPTANTSSAFLFRFCDNLKFKNCFAYVTGERRGWGLRIKPAAGDLASRAYPAEIEFGGVPIGGLSLDTSDNVWRPDLNSGRGFDFSILNDGDMTDPGYIGAVALPTSPDLGGHEGVSGRCSSGMMLDRFQPVQTRAGIVTYGQSILVRDSTTVQVINTAVATAVFTQTIPANVLKVFDRTPNANTYKKDRTLRVTLEGSYFNNSGSPANLTLLAKLGGQTMFNLGTVSIAAGATFRSILLQLDVTETNASEAQQCASGICRIGAGGSGSGTAASGGTQYDQHQTGKTVDITAAQTLEISVQHGTADANIRFEKNMAMVELL